MKSPILITLSFVAILSACSNESDSTKIDLETAVRSGLIDPQSATFGSLALSDNRTFACIEFNAKNRIGGYAGQKIALAERNSNGWSIVRYDALPHECTSSALNRLETDRKIDLTLAMNKPPSEDAVSAHLRRVEIENKSREIDAAIEKSQEDFLEYSVAILAKNLGISVDVARPVLDQRLREIDDCVRMKFLLFSDIRNIETEERIPTKNSDLRQLKDSFAQKRDQWSQSVCVK